MTVEIVLDIYPKAQGMAIIQPEQKTYEVEADRFGSFLPMKGDEVYVGYFQAKVMKREFCYATNTIKLFCDYRP